jgi:hypothetical protein
MTAMAGMSVFSQHSCVAILTLNMMALGGEAFDVILGPKVKTSELN